MYYCNYFRSGDPQEFDDLNDIYEPEMDVPFCCPYYRQFFSTQPVDFMSRQPFGDPPFGPQSGPPFGQGPGQGPGQPHGQQSGPPSGPPPSVTPSKQSAMVKSGPTGFAVEPQTLRPCLFRFVYIWPRRGRGFWAWLTFVGRKSASGFRWNGRRWVYFGIDLRQIDSFICY